MSSTKIKSLEELKIIIQTSQSQGKKVIYCHGVFDLLHIGHIRYFDQARQMGDILVVTITPDRYVDKGPHRPAFNEKLRAEAVASLKNVDFVAVNNWPTAEETLRLLRPDAYVKGSDFSNAQSDPTGKLAKEEQVTMEIGAEMAFTEDIVFSSTNLINRFLSTFPKNTQQYLNIFKTRYVLDNILTLLDRFADLRVVLIGDTIIDDYQYCHTLGVSSKDPALALQYESNDIFAGGVLAIANHLADFVKEVQLITILGDRDSQENFIRSRLHHNVKPHFIYKKNTPTTIKRRFIEGYSINKLFEVYIMDDSPLPAAQEDELLKILAENLGHCDLALAADFGHGAIGDRTRDILIRQAPFLAVNTQANAGNRGFHTISRYSKCDFVSLSEGEIQLEYRDIHGDIRQMVGMLAEKMQTTFFAATLGKRGCLIKNSRGRAVEIPALVQQVVDRVGSGDAFFSITALAACLKVSPELLGFLGNAVGGLAVEILGNQKSINKMNLKKFIISLLK